MPSEQKRNAGNKPAEVWLSYESEKKRIAGLGLTPAEYEQAIRCLADRLGV